MERLKRILEIGIGSFICLMLLTACSNTETIPPSFGYNKGMIDTNYHFTKCITWVGDKIIEIEIDKWNDYEGEQIQIKGKDGNVYLVSSMNSILINEK